MAERRWFAIAAIGRDRPGIVADLSQCIYECGCNLEDASMTTLGKEFATLMLVSSLDEDVHPRLSEAMRRLEWERRLTVFLRPLEGEPLRREEPEGRSELLLTAQGVDKAGIVAGIAGCLAEHGVLITDLRGKIRRMPQTGTPLYTLSLRIRPPAELDLEALHQRLLAVAERLDVELELRPTA